jgi:hypothetical protein
VPDDRRRQLDWNWGGGCHGICCYESAGCLEQVSCRM